MDESLVTTASRELHEETGLVGQHPKLLTVVSGPNMQYRYPNGDQIDSVTAVYALTATGTVQTSNETSQVQYFSRQDLPVDLTPITKQILTELKF